MTLTDTMIGHLGPFGRLRAFSCLPASISNSFARVGTRGTTINGHAFTQQTPHSARTWTWPINVADTATLRELYAIEAGVFGAPPYRWYDPWAAEHNMIPRGAAVPGSELDLSELAWHSSTTVTAVQDPQTYNDLPVAHGVDVTGDMPLVAPARDSVEDPVPVLPGKAYTFTVNGLKVDGDAWEARLVWVDRDMVQLSTDVTTVAPDASPQRAVVTAVAPDEAAGVLVEVAAGAYETVSDVTLLQLVECDHAVEWSSGLGVPHVSLPFGFDELLHRARHSDSCTECSAQSKRGMPSLVLVEVG